MQSATNHEGSEDHDQCAHFPQQGRLPRENVKNDRRNSAGTLRQKETKTEKEREKRGKETEKREKERRRDMKREEEKYREKKREKREK